MGQADGEFDWPAAQDDPLELLVPAGGEERALAARWTAALRLVRSAGRCRRSPSTAVNVREAARVLELCHRDADHAALERLLGLYLDVCLPEASWLGWSSSVGGDGADAWARLGNSARGAPPVPEPREEPLEVARRLVALAGEAQLADERLGLWRARLAVLEGDRLPLARRSCPASLADRVALRLDAGDLAGALGLLHGAVELDARARFLAAAAYLLDEGPELAPTKSGDARRAAPGALALVRQTGATFRPWPRGLGEALGALGAPAGESEPAGRGRAASGRSGRAGGALECATYGASVLVLSALVDAGQGRLRRRLVLRDGGGGSAEREAAWERGRQGAWRRPGEPEQALVAGGEVVRWDRTPGEEPWDAALSTDSRCLVLVPLTGPAGRLIGWIQLEFARHLVPARAELEALAGEAAEWLIARRSSEGRNVGPAADRRSAVAGPAAEVPAGGALGAVFRDLVSDLGMKTSRRRWYGFGMESGEPRLVAQGGRFGGAEPAAGFAGQGLALERAAASAAVVAWSEQAELLGLDVRSASGTVIPLVQGSETLALFAVESTAKRDLRAADVERIAALLEARRADVRGALFRSLHERLYGWEPHLPAGCGDFGPFATRLADRSQHRAPVVLVGGAGAGKGVLARWVHEHRRRAGHASAERLTPWSGAAQGCLIQEPETWTADAQQELLELLDGPVSARSSLVVTTERDPRLAPTGLQPRLARALSRVVLRVPDLAQRRAEIPGWVDAICSRLASDESLPSPRFADEALALLWRQPWPSNLRDLDVVLHGMLLESRGEVLGAQDVHRGLLNAGLEPQLRLPSRTPSRADMLAALATTRTNTGRINKTRAALYLGWDPDTLVTRARDLEISLDDPPAPEPWMGGEGSHRDRTQ